MCAMILSSYAAVSAELHTAERSEPDPSGVSCFWAFHV